MLITIGVFILSFIWLLKETNFLRLRLPCGKIQTENYTKCLTKMLNENRIEVEKYLVMKPAIPQLAQYCEQTKFLMQFKDNCYKPSWTNYRRKSSMQEMVINGNKIKIYADLPNLYEIIAEAEKQDSKQRQPRLNFPPIKLTEEIRVGSHKEHMVSNWEYNGKHREWDEVVVDYKTVYHDCLCGKEWLEAHYKDVIPEPEIELIVDEKSFHFNGNYEKNCISKAMESRVRKQRKMIEAEI